MPDPSGLDKSPRSIGNGRAWFMPSAVSPQNDKPQPTRLKLVMHSRDHQDEPSHDTGSWQEDSPIKKESSGSPPRPSYSPVTPTLVHTSLIDATSEIPAQPLPEWIDQPEGEPVSLEENADAIAVRAAISVLQMQRQQSLRDIRGLEVMKQTAMAEPEAFVEALKAGRLAKTPASGVELDSESEDDDHIQEDVQSKFGKFPPLQNIVRCPPVAWEKYHVIGEPLDKLHEEQRRRPGTKEDAYGNVVLAPEHVIAAPYRPLIDKVDEPMMPR